MARQALDNVMKPRIREATRMGYIQSAKDYIAQYELLVEHTIAQPTDCLREINNIRAVLETNPEYVALQATYALVYGSVS
jgi:hypothetical protein